MAQSKCIQNMVPVPVSVARNPYSFANGLGVPIGTEECPAAAAAAVVAVLCNREDNFYRNSMTTRKLLRKLKMRYPAQYSTWTEENLLQLVQSHPNLLGIVPGSKLQLVYYVGHDVRVAHVRQQMGERHVLDWLEDHCAGQALRCPQENLKLVDGILTTLPMPQAFRVLLDDAMAAYERRRAALDPPLPLRGDLAKLLRRDRLSRFRVDADYHIVLLRRRNA
eukprot:EG_transcript_26089